MRKHTSSGYVTSEPLLLAVAMQQTTSPILEVSTEEWGDLCMDCGCWEWIDGELDGQNKSIGEGKKERNEFGGESGILAQQTKAIWCIFADSGALK